MFHVKHKKQIIKQIFLIEAEALLDLVKIKNAINKITQICDLTCNFKNTEQLRIRYKTNEKYQKKL